jgi:hypothetical protein
MAASNNQQVKSQAFAAGLAARAPATSQPRMELQRWIMGGSWGAIREGWEWSARECFVSKFVLA